MELLNHSDTARIIRRFRVTDGPVHPMSYSTSDRRFQTDWVTVTYLLDDGVWTSKSYSSIELGGYVLKKDGTPGQAYHTRHPEHGPEYQWVLDLAEKARPVGNATFPAVEG